MTTCLDEATVMSFLAGTLPPAARGGVETHVAACSACAEILTWAAADSANASRAPGREGAPFLGQLAPGARVDRYQILGPIGRGGMGEVYAAYHPDLDRRIALKIVFETGGDAAERRARLLREARAIARLSHPNVIAVFDAGTVGDRVYIAMEFIDGDTLDAWLKAAPRAWQEILDVFASAGRGLAAAHAAKIIHRDFKPQNVMIAKDGSVRVMDFGLAQLVREEATSGPGTSHRDTTGNGDGPLAGEATERSNVATSRATKTGALLGTPAYMAPEQWRGTATDARADQFSFCVAFHEALFGVRPTIAHLGQQVSKAEPAPPPRTGVPAWLRAVLARGLAKEREQRFPVMEDLLRALTRGRTRPRRRALLASSAIAAVLLTGGAIKLARGGRISCSIPKDRIAAAWPVDDPTDRRRESLHRAFVATGRPSAETSWARVSRALDEYVRQWSTMYADACEATHVRGEQSGEVLDLRMACLAANLDEVRAFREVLASADSEALGRAVSGVQDLAPMTRCADLPYLRSAVPLPRDERTLKRVEALKRSLMEVRALNDLGNFVPARNQGKALRSPVEATGYKPLLGETLELIGRAESEVDTVQAEHTLEDAFLVAEESRDDATAALATATLTYVVGYGLARPEEGKRWARISNAILNRPGPGHARTRSWMLNNLAAIYVGVGDFQQGRVLFEQAIRIKEEVLGKEHPDIAVSLSNLAQCYIELGLLRDAVEAADRAISILSTHGDPDTPSLAESYDVRGMTLQAAGRYQEAARDFRQALAVLHRSNAFRPTHTETGSALHGLGAATLAQADPAGAARLFEEALSLREKAELDVTLIADTQFGLARALWNSGGDRVRARSLATKARATFAAHERTRREQAVAAWLDTHRSAIR